MGSRCWKCILQALTKGKLYIVSGPEFEELQGHVLVMHKALYGMTTNMNILLSMLMM